MKIFELNLEANEIIEIDFLGNPVQEIIEPKNPSIVSTSELNYDWYTES